MSTQLNVRILADENIGQSLMSALCTAGYDASSVTERTPGIRHVDILYIAPGETTPHHHPRQGFRNW